MTRRAAPVLSCVPCADVSRADAQKGSPSLRENPLANPLVPGSAPNRGRDRSRGSAPVRGRLQARAAHDFGGMADLPDPYALRAAMADRWGLWVRRHFRRPEDVAVAFGVTFQAARNWFDGLHRPSGETVLMAQLVWGGEFTAFMREGV